MKIGFLLPSLFASATLFPERIFAPKELAIHTINGLVKKGHQVFVFSTPDFPAQGTLIPTDSSYFQKNISFHKLRNDPEPARLVRTDEVIKRNFELACTAHAFGERKNLDIVHSYHDFVFTPHYFEEVTGFPVVYTLHDPLPPQNTFEYEEFNKFKEHNYVSISNAQRKSGLPLNFVNTVYHGIDLDAFPFQKEASDYLLFMGRLVPEKGLHTAIQVALTLNIQLEIGTHFPDHDQESDYFKNKIKPYLHEPVIGEPGMVNDEDKKLLYKEARALLFPIEWEEPFGMVMIEAMACGTPVIAYNRGSVAEIVRDGVTGFIVEPDDKTNPKSQIPNPKNNPTPPPLNLRGGAGGVIKKTGVAGLVEAVGRIGEIDRAACRQHVKENFTVTRMVDNYEKVYQKVMKSR